MSCLVRNKPEFRGLPPAPEPCFHIFHTGISPFFVIFPPLIFNVHKLFFYDFEFVFYSDACFFEEKTDRAIGLG